MNGGRGGAKDAKALLALFLILALVPFLLASRGNDMPTPWDYQEVKCDGNMATDRDQGNIGKAGEYKQQAWPGAPDTPHAASSEQNVYPNCFRYGYNPSNRQFAPNPWPSPFEPAEPAPGIKVPQRG